MNHVIDFAVGAVLGGLLLSAAWGLFWLGVGSIGFSRGTCGWRVAFNGMTVAVVPLLLAWGVVSFGGGISPPQTPFFLGLATMPMLLLGLGLRPVPDGRRAGAQMLEGVRHLMDELLGAHHHCDGCGDQHDPRQSGG